MQTNNHFSSHRFLLLCRQSLIINKKLIGISLIGAAGTLFLTLLFFQSINSFQFWSNYASMIFFLFCYVSLGGIYTSQAFPAFRSKEKSLVYLLLPASAFEKFIFEFLTRIVVLILFLPAFYWLVANVEGVIVHHYVPRLINYKFSFKDGLNQIITNWKISGWNMSALVQFCLFVYFTTFTGACHFSKSPRMKTLFTLSVITVGYVLFVYLLRWVFDLKHYAMFSKSIFFLRSKEDIYIFLSIIGIVVNLSLIAISWYRFKEKEV